MSELREQIAAIVEVCNGWHMGEGYPLKAADTILALIPKPTVRVKCDKCGGKGFIVDEPEINATDKCFSCTDGWNEHEIVWAFPNGGDYVGLMPLTLLHLIDPDVAWTYSWFHHCGGWQKELPHNKGTLRIGGKVK